jgi:hypothetical protein
LEIHFKLGELDIQASREGLSFIPSTIAAIRRRFEDLMQAVETHLEKRVNELDNLWDKVQYLESLRNNPIFSAAIKDCCTKLNLPHYNPNFVPGSWQRVFTNLEFKVEDVRNNWNIKMTRFKTSTRGSSNMSLIKPERNYDSATQTYTDYYPIDLSSKNIVFVLSDCRAGQSRRVRNHFGRRRHEGVNEVVLLEQFDKDGLALYDEFLRTAHNPKVVIKSSTLDKPERAEKSTPQGIFELEAEQNYRVRRRGIHWKWKRAGKSTMPKTVYYVPMKNKTVELTNIDANFDHLVSHMKDSGIANLVEARIFGVRKYEAAKIKNNHNWMPLEKFIAAELSKITDTQLDDIAYENFYDSNGLSFKNKIAKALPNESPFKHFYGHKSLGSKVTGINLSAYDHLAKLYCPDRSIENRVGKLNEESSKISSRYPLINQLYEHRTKIEDVVQYINLIDKYGK